MPDPDQIAAAETVTNRVHMFSSKGRRDTCFTAAWDQRELEIWAQQAAEDNPQHIYYFEGESA